LATVYVPIVRAVWSLRTFVGPFRWLAFFRST
jgi:hypothetical protein